MYTGWPSCNKNLLADLQGVALSKINKEVARYVTWKKPCQILVCPKTRVLKSQRVWSHTLNGGFSQYYCSITPWSHIIWMNKWIQTFFLCISRFVRTLYKVYVHLNFVDSYLHLRNSGKCNSTYYNSDSNSNSHIIVIVMVMG
jgi:hypothetical protein